MSLIGFLWSLIKLPIKLILLPYRILSAIISIIIYGAILLVIGLLVFIRGAGRKLRPLRSGQLTFVL